jgi:hypothetical protein
MITTVEDLQTTEGSVFVLSQELAESLLKTTRNKRLKKIIDKGSFTITSNIRDEIFSKIKELKTNMEKARELAPKTGAGRKRKDYTDEELEALSPEEKKRYKNAKWQRQSRFNRGLTKKA